MVNGSRGRLRRRATAKRHLRSVEPSLAQGPDDRAVLSDEHRAVALALRTLPVRQRACLALRFYDDLTEAQIAETLDGEHAAPAWVDDPTIISQRRCCSPYDEETPRFVFSDAETGMELRAADGADGRAIELAVGPDGRILFLLEAPIEGRLTLPGPGGAVEVEGVRSADG